MSDCLYGKLNSETIKKEYQGDIEKIDPLKKDTVSVLVDNVNNIIRAQVNKTPKKLTIVKNSLTGNKETYNFDGSEDININLHEVDAYSGKSTNETASVIVDNEQNTIDVQVLKTPNALTITKGEEILGVFNGSETLRVNIPDPDLSGIESNIETISDNINVINSTIQDLSGNIDTISEDLSNTQTELSSTQATLSNVEQDVSILETEGDGTKYLADNGQYKEVAGGIEQLIGTDEKPINLATDMEVGRLYIISGYIFMSNNVKYNEMTNGALAYKRTNSNGSIGYITIFNRDLNGYQFIQSPNNIIININNTTGVLQYESFPGGVRRINGNLPSTTISNIYAPTSSGTAGQILQSSGANSTPTWFTPDYASQSYVDTQIASLVDSAPETLDTLKELADAIAKHKDILDAIGELPTVTRLI